MICCKAEPNKFRPFSKRQTIQKAVNSALAASSMLINNISARSYVCHDQEACSGFNINVVIAQIS